ncbi:MAG: futalosine hydrolase [Geobacteraceae bacterium]|nr:futalosine hydrolase [Geobacteraceae bacterium]
MRTIAVTAATPLEIRGLVEAFDAQRYSAPLPWDVFFAEETSTKIIFTITGIGTANAAAASALVAHLFTPDLLITTGCAGAYPGCGLEIGDIALATTEVFADEGVVIHEGWRSLEHIGIPLLDQNGNHFFNEIPLSSRANTAALQIAEQLGIASLATGRFLTVATCSGTNARSAELQERFGGLCENMEGAAVALIAARYGIDCMELRGISNYVENRDISRWDIRLAATNSQRFLKQFIRNQCLCKR